MSADLHHESDAALLARIERAHAMADAAALTDAFAVIQFRHQSRIRGRVALKLPGDRIDETVQEIFLALFEAVVTGTAIANVQAWLNKVAANHVADFHRGRHAQALKGSSSLDAEDAPVLTDDGGAGLAELEDVIERLLSPLEERHRTAVQLAVFENRPAREVADACGESEANVYQIARRFRVALRAVLDGENPS